MSFYFICPIDYVYQGEISIESFLGNTFINLLNSQNTFQVSTSMHNALTLLWKILSCFPKRSKSRKLKYFIPQLFENLIKFLFLQLFFYHSSLEVNREVYLIIISKDFEPMSYFSLYLKVLVSHLLSFPAHIYQ